MAERAPEPAAADARRHLYPEPAAPAGEPEPAPEAPPWSR
jgi:hypothetical protein